MASVFSAPRSRGPGEQWLGMRPLEGGPPVRGFIQHGAWFPVFPGVLGCPLSSRRATACRDSHPSSGRAEWTESWQRGAGGSRRRFCTGSSCDCVGDTDPTLTKRRVHTDVPAASRPLSALRAHRPCPRAGLGSSSRRPPQRSGLLPSFPMRCAPRGQASRPTGSGRQGRTESRAPSLRPLLRWADVFPNEDVAPKTQRWCGWKLSGRVGREPDAQVFPLVGL
ncbi:hypothetical protein HJG60_011589 [Phyllostomus discolor]|uniref:Uncharacterized protein n=1 Tax=Phyllostomus discolor TaxID=89673 RepID=A0A834E3A0_9CHIR|nr:hypothetical protein HJG60_011589 [Phyllostomus discolor]